MNSMIEVEYLSFGYGRQESILKNINFRVEAGTFLAVIGPNGVGKSTLLNLLCHSLRAGAGAIRIDGASIETYSYKTLAKKVAVVRQEFVPIFGFSVRETVSMARVPYYGPLGFPGKTDTDLIQDALRVTETAHLARRPIASLSGGERQRVFIARALAQDTDILLLDEPTTFLDPRHQVAIYDLLKTAQITKGRTVVAVTHDINLAAQYSDQILLLSSEDSYKFGPPNDVLVASQIEKVFGVRLHVGTVGNQKFFMPLGKYAKSGGDV